MLQASQDLMTKAELKAFLDQKVSEINVPDFIHDDPIQIPRQYSIKQDIEITAFWTAMLSWGQRKTIIRKCSELFELMGASPFQFIIDHKESDRRRFSEFKHRTFQYTDCLYFLEFMQWYYRNYESMEDHFRKFDKIRDSLDSFHQMFFHLESAPQRTKKHVSCPAKNSSCKRLNMFLRWMVRKDNKGVDFGIWNSISPSELMIPLDVHVERVARRLGLLHRKQRDWKAVEELTNNLRQLHPEDPVKYDYALYGMGVLGEL